MVSISVWASTNIDAMSISGTSMRRTRAPSVAFVSADTQRALTLVHFSFWSCAAVMLNRFISTPMPSTRPSAPMVLPAFGLPWMLTLLLGLLLRSLLLPTMDLLIGFSSFDCVLVLVFEQASVLELHQPEVRRAEPVALGIFQVTTEPAVREAIRFAR